MRSTITRRRHRGYTLIELLTTVAVAAIVTTAAVPGLRSFVQNNRIAAQTNELVGSLVLARSEAVTRGVATTVCASSDGASCSGSTDWASGWLVFADLAAPLGALDAGTDVLVRAHPGLESGAALTGSTAAVTYRADGFLDAASAVNFEVRIAACTGHEARDVAVGLSGRTAVEPIAC
jgi:type IV fimbrial biogenesis protein FimT